MIKFTMGSSDTKKMQRRKPKRTNNKSFSATTGAVSHPIAIGGINQSPITYQNTSLSNVSVGISTSPTIGYTAAGLSAPATVLPTQTYSQANQADIQLLQKLMDSPDCLPMSRDRCLLCQAPLSAKLLNSQSDDTLRSGVGVTSSQLQMWVCSDCRRTVEEEEEKRTASNLLEQDLMLGPPTSPANLSSSSDNDGPSGDGAMTCSCDSCKERRRIEEEQERETAELQKAWSDLRYHLLFVFHEAVNKTTDEQLKSTDRAANSDEILTPADRIVKAQELLERLCLYDPHELYHRVESTCREYIIQRKAYLTHQCPVVSAGSQQVLDASPESVRHLVETLLNEYVALTSVCQTMSVVVGQLERDHLSRFQLTSELLFRHLFNSVIYVDIKKHLPNLVQQLRSLSPEANESSETASKETPSQLLCRFLTLDTEMMQVAVRWRECYQLIEQYNDEQDAAKVKQKMLQEDWEFFRTQRRLLEQHVLKQRISHQRMDEHAADAVAWQRQQGNKGDVQYPCPGVAQTNRCTCDECSILRMVASGIVSPELTEQLAHSPGDGKTSFLQSLAQQSSCFAGMNHLPACGGAGDCGNHGQTFLQFGSSYDIGQCEIPEEFDAEGEDEDDYPDHASAVQSAWMDQRLVEGQDSASCCPTSKRSKVVNLNGEAAGGKYNDEANGSSNDGDSEDESKYEDAWMPNQQQPVQSAQRQQPCQCQYCYQQQLPSCMIEPPPPFFMQPPLQPASNVQSAVYPEHLPNGTTAGIQPGRQPLIAPQLYQLHCNATAATTAPSRGRCPGDGMVSHNSKLMPPLFTSDSLQQSSANGAYQDAKLMPPLFTTDALASTFNGVYQDISQLQQQQLGAGGFFSSWNEAYKAVKCPTFSTAVSTMSFSLLGSQSTGIAASAAVIPCPSTVTVTTTTAWRIPSFNTQSMIASTSPLSLTSSSSAMPVQCSSAPSAFSVPSPQRTTSAAVAVNQPVMFQQPNLGGQLGGIQPSSVAPFSNAAASDITSTPKKPAATAAAAAAAVKKSPQLSGAAKPTGGLFVGGGTEADKTPASVAQNTAQSKCRAAAVPPNVSNNSVCLKSAKNVQSAPSCNGGAALSECGSANCHRRHCVNECDDDEDDDDDEEGSLSDDSSSTSNQKDGKFCECWHCEFFGHSGPPTVPTSKNYPEMRERLRLRLKKKQDAPPSSLQNEQKTETVEEQLKSPIVRPPTCTAPRCEQQRQNMNVDEILRFINGDNAAPETKTSRKAAKRARQKQRKAAEKKQTSSDVVDGSTLWQEKVAGERNSEQGKSAPRPIQMSMEPAESPNNTSASSSVSSIDQQPVQKKKATSKGNDLAADRSAVVPAVCSAKSSMKSGATSLPNGVTADQTKSVMSKDTIAAQKQPSSVLQNGHCNGESGNRNRINVVQKSVTGSKPAGRYAMQDGVEKQKSQSLTNGNVASNHSAMYDSSSPAASVSSSNGSPQPVPPAAKFAKSKRQLKLDTVLSASDTKHQPAFSQDKVADKSKPASAAAPVKSKTQNPAVNVGPSANAPIMPNHRQNAAPSPRAKQLAATNCNGEISNKSATASRSEQAPKSATDGQKAVVSNPVQNGQSLPVASPAANAPSVTQNDALPTSKQPFSRIAQNCVESLASLEPSLPTNGYCSSELGAGAKGKKSRRKGRGKGELNSVDEIFLPKENVEQGHLDEFEREIEEFKRFCFNSTMADNREKLQVNMNLKDIFAKKKTMGNGCA